jgi:hypothetical protein
MLRFRRMRTAQTYLPVHSSARDHFKRQSHLYSRKISSLTTLLLLLSGVSWAWDEGRPHCPGTDWFAMV